MRGRQWLADRVAAANRSDAFHIDSPISENNFVSPERFQNIPKTFQIHSKYIPEAMLIPEIFLTQKTASLIVSPTPLLWYALFGAHSQRRVELRVRY